MAAPTGRVPQDRADGRVVEPAPALLERIAGPPQGAQVARVAGLLEAAFPAQGPPEASAVVGAWNGASKGLDAMDVVSMIFCCVL